MIGLKNLENDSLSLILTKIWTISICSENFAKHSRYRSVLVSFFSNVQRRIWSFVKQLCWRFSVNISDSVCLLNIFAKNLHQWRLTGYYIRLSEALSPEVFLIKGVLKECRKFAGEHPCRSVISIKLLYYFIEITVRPNSFPVNLLHVFRILFPKNTSGRLLLTCDALVAVDRTNVTQLKILKQFLGDILLTRKTPAIDILITKVAIASLLWKHILFCLNYVNSVLQNSLSDKVQKILRKTARCANLY